MSLLFHLLFSTVSLLICDGAHMGIINGDEVLPHSRPYMAFIGMLHEGKPYICAGSLIRDNWVLTAAHCRINVSTTVVTLGVHSIKEKESEKQRIKVIDSFQYKPYNRKNKRNDILLLKLSQKAELGPAVDILPLPKTYEDVERNAVCEIAGWGLTEEGKWSDTLRKVNVTVLSREECHRKWRHKYAITEDMMCTNVGPNREDPCQGDSGSPLICDGVFRAIDSFGDRPCGTPYTTNVFTRLTEKFISWIEDTVSDTD